MRVALLLREVRVPIRHDEAEVAGARVIDTRVVDLVEDAVAQCEPHSAVATDSSADPGFRARSPAGRETRPPRGERFSPSGAARNRAHLRVWGHRSHH